MIPPFESPYNRVTSGTRYNRRVKGRKETENLSFSLHRKMKRIKNLLTGWRICLLVYKNVTEKKASLHPRLTVHK